MEFISYGGPVSADGSFQHPVLRAVFSAGAAQACFELATLSPSKQCPPSIYQRAEVIGMDHGVPTRANGLFEQLAGVVEPSLADEIDKSVGLTGP